MEDKEKLRKIIGDTRKNKNIARDKVSELLKLKGIDYSESALSRYENGITKTIKAEVIKGLSEILGLNVIEMYKLAGLINKNNDPRIAELNKKEKIQLEDVMSSANHFFKDETYDDETKEKLLLSLQELFFDAKQKNKKKK